MYTVKYQTESGWQFSSPIRNLVDAEDEFNYYSQYYVYVSIIQTETVTNETTIKDSTS